MKKSFTADLGQNSIILHSILQFHGSSGGKGVIVDT